MTYAYEPDYEPDGSCRNCGKALAEDGDHQDFHTLCWACWRAESGIEDATWRKPRPAPGSAPGSFIEGLAMLRQEVRELAARLDALEAVVEELLTQRVDELARRRRGT